MGTPKGGAADAHASGSSAEAGARASRSDAAPPTEACRAVSDLAVTASSATSITLSWAGAPGVGVTVSRETYCGADDYVTVAALPPGVTSYTDRSVQAEWVYWYKITAGGGSGSVSAAIASQASPTPATGCSAGATPRVSGIDSEACATPVDSGSPPPKETDSGGTLVDAGGDAPSIPGASCPVAAGADQATIQAALDACGSGNTVLFAAGTYGPLTSTLTIPCGVSLSGPPVPYSQTPNQTATINGSESFIGWALQTTAGCSAAQTIQFLEWDGKQPGGAGGGGFLEINPGTTNLTVMNNWLHGVNAPSTDHGAGQNIQANLINFGGAPSGAVTSEVRVLYNVFGSMQLSDCAGAITETATEMGGGYCNGVGIGANVVNVAIQYNVFHWLEQGMKFYEGQGECNPLTVSNNDYSHIQRIMYETQCNNASAPVAMNIQYNSFHDRGEPGIQGQQNYDLSAANGCTHPTLDDPTNCVTHVDYNVDVQAATGQSDVGIEIWGGSGTTANYNYLRGSFGTASPGQRVDSSRSTTTRSTW